MTKIKKYVIISTEGERKLTERKGKKEKKMLKVIEDKFMYKVGGTEYRTGLFTMDEKLTRDEIFDALAGYCWGGQVTYALMDNTENTYKFYITVRVD